MFTAEDFRHRFRQRPFVPIRIRTGFGEVYEIHYPEMVMVGNGWLAIGMPGRRRPNVPEPLRQVAMAHITTIDNLPSDAVTGGPPESEAPTPSGP